MVETKFLVEYHSGDRGLEVALDFRQAECLSLMPMVSNG